MELTAAKGIGPSLAEAIVTHFTGADESADALAPAVNMTTGEILET
jgi:excinuclease ABC subunit C